MKKINFILILNLIIIFPIFTIADTGNSLERILSEIKTSQNINSINEINCAKATNEQFEKLGDAVMDLMHPDEEEHKLMDQMMGGENSVSLKAMHVLMGKRYLGCVGQKGIRMTGTRGIMNYDYPEMMTGFNNWHWFWFIYRVLILVLLIIGIIALLKWLFQRKNGS